MSKGRFQNLQTRLTKRLLQWGDGQLAQPRREVLIKSVAQALPTYIMRVFKVPFSVCDDLTRMVRNFYRGSAEGKRRVHWRGWDHLMQPKAKGGVGFRDFRMFNQALLARQAWRLLTKPDSLCAQVLKARYYPLGRLDDTVFTGNASSSWQAISYGLDLLKKGLVWRVGNGRSIRVWRDKWISRPYSYKPISPQGRCRIRFVSDLLNQNGSWNYELLNEYFVDADVQEIAKIRASPRLEEDVIAWGPGKHGVFTIKSAYTLAFEEAHRATDVSSSSSPSDQRKCWDFIWKSWAPPSVHNFAWRLATNSLPTWQRKHKIGLEVGSRCPVCGREEEDNFHPFVNCQFGRDLYLAMAKVWMIPEIESIEHNGKEWLLHVLESLNDVGRMMVLMIFWRSWFVRNEVVHYKPAPSMEASIRFLRSYVDSLIGIKLYP